MRYRPLKLSARAAGWDRSLRATTLRSVSALTCIALVAITQAGAMGGAVWGVTWLFSVSALVGILVDQVAERMEPVGLLLERSQLGLVTRAMIREFAFVVLLARLPWPDVEVLLTAALTFVVIIARAAAASADRQSAALQMPKVTTRNLSVTALEDSTPVSPLELPRIVLSSATPLVAGIIGLLLGTLWPFYVAAVAFSLIAAGWILWRLGSLLQHRRTTDPQADMTQASDEVAKLRPEVVLYFSGTPDAMYQINTWLPVMEQLGHPVLIVLRERENLQALAPTKLPVVCIPGASDLMDFRLPTVRVAFYVAHVGKNIHLLREPRMKHVFIGHGESDKVASVNPATKVFDEVWVAGRASRERWAAAKVGVRDDAIVEVGRPQLGEIRLREDRSSADMLSVLYAPTWEGWTSDPFTCSLTTMGPSLVGWLLKRPNTRVIYRPHPFTGSVLPAARRANAQVIGLLEKHAEFGRLPRRGGSVTESEWSAVAGKHIVSTSEDSSLYDCFNHADILIGDISSVVPDFVASGKPYLVPNPAGRDHAELRRDHASLRAAYILDPRSADWSQLLQGAITDDPLRQAREQLRLDLLGPYYPDAVEPWRTALSDLIDRANEEWPDGEREAAFVDN